MPCPVLILTGCPCLLRLAACRHHPPASALPLAAGACLDHAHVVVSTQRQHVIGQRRSPSLVPLTDYAGDTKTEFPRTPGRLPAGGAEDRETCVEVRSAAGAILASSAPILSVWIPCCQSVTAGTRIIEAIRGRPGQNSPHHHVPLIAGDPDSRAFNDIGTPDSETWRPSSPAPRRSAPPAAPAIASTPRVTACKAHRRAFGWVGLRLPSTSPTPVSVAQVGQHAGGLPAGPAVAGTRIIEAIRGAARPEFATSPCTADRWRS